MIERDLYFENSLFRLIYSFHMPCLMLLSGFFFKRTVDRKDFWDNRVKTLLIPIIAWPLIPVGIIILKAYIHHSTTDRIILSIGETIFTYYWFLWAILFNSVIVWLVHRFLDDSILGHLVIGIGFYFVPTILNVHLWIFMYPYFVVGYLWNKNGVQIKRIENHKIITTCLLGAVDIALFLFYNSDSFIYTTGITVRSLTRFRIDLYRYAIGFVGSALVIWVVYILYQKIESKAFWLNRGLTYCGQISLTIYIIDCLLNSYVLPRMTNGFTLNYGIAFVETIVVMLICISIDYIIKKVPVARRVLPGSR